MPRRVGLLLSVAGVISVVAVGALSYQQLVHRLQPKQTSAQMKRLIEEHLPLGSTVQQTVAFLHANHVQTDIAIPNRGGTEDIERADPQGSTLRAAIPDAYPGIFVSGGIFMKFGFNAQGRLARYDVRDVYTGL